ncbi:MAG: fumarylacetoacetate hydrolase family protein [Gemmatimonadetes bacterium]|nr:fumarylacetoacetate hydrolase family protein [Gemmatimonadota bacterium]
MRPLSLITGLFFAGTVSAQPAPTPFKVGTLSQGDRVFVGVVVRDSFVIDFNAAHRAVTAQRSTLAAVADMKDLITRYDAGVRARIVELIAAAGDVSRANRPAWVHQLRTLKILPPIMYPTVMLNVAVNYAEHDIEMARGRLLGSNPPTAGRALEGTTSSPGIWERASDDWRWNPYMFMKSPGVIVAHGEPVRIPPKRDRIEWECELGVVIGKTTTRPTVDQAGAFIFGFTNENDMSDRGGRGDSRHGSDWVISKNHDTFAPMGPFITPKEFIPDVGRMKMTFVLNGEELQTGTTAQMIHNVFEQVAYASGILTLRPGDVIATGTPPGVGSARNPPILLKAGDRMACSYEGVGTLSNPVVATP